MTAEAIECSRASDTDRGPGPERELLDRMTGQAARRWRWLHALLEDVGPRPDDKP